MDLERRNKDKGFAVLGVSMDDEGWEVVKPFLSDLGVNYRVVIGNEETSQLYGGVDALPTTFLIDRAGKIAAVHVGLADRRDSKMVSNSFCSLPRLPLLAALLCLPSLFAQSSGYLTVGEPQKVAGKRNAAVQAKIPVSVRPGFHVNSNTPTDEYLIPLKLTWTAAGALEGGSVTYPKPSLEKYEFAEKPLSVFTGNFELVANFKVAANAPAGPGAAVGKLRYQACNDRACFPPKTVDVTVPYQIQ